MGIDGGTREARAGRVILNRRSSPRGSKRSFFLNSDRSRHNAIELHGNCALTLYIDINIEINAIYSALS